ncbi:MAG: hypothetical protein AAF525_10195 [Pseudomonadota bacterium]
MLGNLKERFKWRRWAVSFLLLMWASQALGFIPPEQLTGLPESIINQYTAAEELVKKREYVAAGHQVESMIAALPDTSALVFHLHHYAGDIYLKANDLESALRHLNSAVVANGSESFSSDLVGPLQVLAMIYLRLEMVEEAEQALLRAQNITHRHKGVYTTQQLEILEELTALKARNLIEAEQERLYRYHLRIHENAFGSGDVRTTPSVLRLAHHLGDKAVRLRYGPNGYKRRVYRQESHKLFERAIESMKAEHGPHSPLLLQPLRDYVSMLYRHRGRYDRRMAGKRRSIEIIREIEQIIAAQPDVTQADLAAARVAIADLYVIWGKPGALRVYQEAWDMIADDPELELARQELFGEPVRLTNRTLGERPEYVRAPPLKANGEPLYSEIEFKVAANGRVRKTETVGGNVPYWRTYRLQQKLEGMKYRPRFVDGEPVETEGLVHVQPYKAGPLSWPRR